MKIDLTELEDEIKEIACDLVNKAGEAAALAATTHVTDTYNTRIDQKNIKTTLATKNNLVFKISVSGRPVSLIKKVVSVTRKGVSVRVKKSPKRIRGAFVAPWQRGQTKRWLFLRKGKLRKSLYTIGLVGMFKSRGTMNAINNSITKTIGKFK